VITDAGGVEVQGGGSVRTGAIYRLSGGLAGPEELARLDAAGLECVVDLRGADEDREAIRAWAAGAGVTYVTQPIPAADRGGVIEMVTSAATVAEAQAALDGVYRRIVDEFAPQVTGTIGAMVGRTVAGYGCAAGKDRTGVVTALLHILLGATEEDAIARYVSGAPSPERLQGLIRGYMGLAEDAPVTPAMAVFATTRPQTMRDTLAHVRERYGGAEAYLRAHGLPDGAAEALREQLVVP